MDYDNFLRFAERHRGKKILLVIEGGAKVIYEPQNDRCGLIGFRTFDGEEEGLLNPRFVRSYSLLDEFGHPDEARANDIVTDLKRVKKKK